MPRRVTNSKIARPSTGAMTKLEDLVLAGMADVVVHGSSVNGKLERDRYVGPEDKDGFA